MAHGSNLESTKAHNLEVEERYVHHQLQKFRQQLARQHPRLQERRIPVRPTKPDFKLNHGPLMQSLAQASRHIDDFYKTPVQALCQAAQLCSTTKQVATTLLVRQLETETEADCEQIGLRDEPVKQTNAANELEMFEYRKFTKQVQLDESRALLLERCRTPSPLLTTEELLKPMRAAAERQMLHLRTVRHEEELQEQEQLQKLQQTEEEPQPEPAPQLQRESSSCSNTSDGIDSVISDLAEEALYELQMEAVEQQKEELDEELADDACVPVPKHVQFQLPQKLLKVVDQPTPSPNEDLFEPLLIRRIEVPKVVLQAKQPQSADQQQEQEACSVSSAEDSPHEKQRIIDQLYQARGNSEQSLMRKYFLKWIHYTSMEKIDGGTGKTTDNRAHKINAFLDKIRQEKKLQRNDKRVTATAPGDVQEKATEKTLEQRQGAIKMAKQFKNKYVPCAPPITLYSHIPLFLQTKGAAGYHRFAAHQTGAPGASDNAAKASQA